MQTEAVEPDVREVVEWLDPAVPDDRIIASALRLQSDNPAGSVLLGTSDINLQNKADTLGIPYIETPPRPSTLRANLDASISWTPGTGGAVAMITLINKGPAVARDVQYSVTPPHDADIRWTAGPWRVASMTVGGADEQHLSFSCAPLASVTARWVDDKPMERSWSVEFPSRPSSPARVGERR